MSVENPAAAVGDAHAVGDLMTSDPDDFGAVSRRGQPRRSGRGTLRSVKYAARGLPCPRKPRGAKRWPERGALSVRRCTRSASI